MQVIHVIKHAHDIKGDLNFDYNKRGIEIFRNMDKSGDMRINCEEFVNAFTHGLRIRIFDLRELWIRVMNDCRYESQRRSDKDME